MNCPYCNGNLIELTGEVEFKSRSLGNVIVSNLKFLKCINCGEKLLDTEEGEKATNYIRKKEQAEIQKLPIGEFITANESAEILKITKQAFSKNYKIRNGLIYSAKIGRKKYYHKKSVELFKEKNNGKFLLLKNEVVYDAKIFFNQIQQKYKTKSISSHPSVFTSHAQKNIAPHIGWMHLNSTNKKGTHSAYK